MKLIQLVLLVFGLGLIAMSCNRNQAITEEEYLIRTDSISVADTVRLNESFQVEFFGLVGENGCFSFSRFYTLQHLNTIQIQVIGKMKTGENLACPENLPMLNGHALVLTADSLGAWKLEVINPGVNQFLRKTVIVVP